MNAALRRRLVLMAALLLTLWAVWEVSQPVEAEQKQAEGSAPSLKRLPTHRPAAVETVFSGELRFPTRPQYEAPVTDLFELPAPPALPTPASLPAQPVAPPLPYVYLGRLEEGGKKKIFLAEGSATTVVAAGARLSGGWSLESIDPGHLVFVYEPLGQKQSLQIREH